jgi:tetratricopeptide (TPR) repeat protein
MAPAHDNASYKRLESVLLDSKLARRVRAGALERQADRSQREARYEEAAAMLQAALKLVSGETRKIAAVSVLERLAENARLRGDYRGAVEYYRRAAGTIEDARGRDNVAWASARVRLAAVLTELGNYPEAETMFAEAMSVLEKSSRVPASELIAVLRGQSILFWRQGRLDEAERAARKALTKIESTPQEKPSRVILDVLQDLHRILSTQGRYKDAESVMERTLALATGQFRVDPTYLAMLQTNLGAQYSEEGRYLEAERLLKEALSSHAKAMRPSKLGLGYTLHNLGVLHSRQREFVDAERHLNQAFEIFQRTLGPESPTVANTWYSLGTLHRDQGEIEKAHDELQRALTIQVSSLADDHPDLKRTRMALASLSQKAEPDKA